MQTIKMNVFEKQVKEYMEQNYQYHVNDGVLDILSLTQDTAIRFQLVTYKYPEWIDTFAIMIQSELVKKGSVRMKRTLEPNRTYSPDKETAQGNADKLNQMQDEYNFVVNGNEGGPYFIEAYKDDALVGYWSNLMGCVCK